MVFAIFVYILIAIVIATCAMSGSNFIEKKREENYYCTLLNIKANNYKLEKIIPLKFDYSFIRQDKKILDRNWDYFHPETLLAFDYEKKIAIFIDYTKVNIEEIPFNKIADCKIIERNSANNELVGNGINNEIKPIISETANNFNKAVTSLSLNIIIDEENRKEREFNIVDKEIRCDSQQYKFSTNTAQELCNTIISIINLNNS